MYSGKLRKIIYLPKYSCFVSMSFYVIRTFQSIRNIIYIILTVFCIENITSEQLIKHFHQPAKKTVIYIYIYIYIYTHT